MGCVAPLMYVTCGSRKSFSAMTPAAKEEWAQNCRVKFPCRERSACDKTYSAPCPADWYTLNGGMSCVAPVDYAGSCAPVLHGLLDLPRANKTTLEGKCQFDWPCLGEVYASVLQVSQASATPRRSIDPAQYASTNGPIDRLS